MKLFPYQREGAKFLAARDRALLADGMGLGKTMQAIAAAAQVDAQSIVVVCPAIARPMWRREFAAWGHGPVPTVLSYDELTRGWGTRFHFGEGVDLLILDEAHYLKSRDAKRTRAVYGMHCRGDGLASKAARVWLLTGTPAPNDVSELWTHFRALWPDLLPGDGKWLTFVQRYCHTDATMYGLKILGNKRDTLPELRERLRRVMVRRRAEDVLTDLPPLVWQHQTIEAKDIDPALRDIEASDTVKALRAVLADEGATPADADNIALASLRRLTGMAKAGVVGNLLAEELGDGAYEKVIVFAHHRDVIAELLDNLSKFGAVSVTGDTPQAARQRAIDRFQGDPRCRVFIGQIQACATAITLHAASQVVFVEASWTPSDNTQAAKRAHRIGQLRPVFVRMFGLAGSIDEAVTRVLARKAQQINQLLEEATA